MSEPRALPGFFWDSDKKKYFRIQANHLAPQDAKYSQQRVKKHQAETRKRKRHERHTVKLQQETIRRSDVLLNPHSQALGRESGFSSKQHTAIASSAAIASQLKRHTAYTLQACYACGQRHVVQDFAPLHGRNSIIVGAGDGRSGILERRPLWPHEDTYTQSYSLGGLPAPISSVNVSPTGTILATTSSTRQPDISIIQDPNTSTFDEDLVPSMMLSIGSNTRTIRTSTLSPSSLERGVVISVSENLESEAIHFDTSNGHLISGIDSGIGSEMRSTDWLDPNTNIIGSTDGNLLLWDLRSSDWSERYVHSGPVYEVRGAGDGHGMWVASRGGLSLYDVRMPSRWRGRGAERWSKPVVSAKMELELGSTAMEVWRDVGLVAVRGDDNSISLFSGVNGRMVKRLEPPDRELGDRGWVGRLRASWDERGSPVLMASIGHVVQAWTYGGVMGDGGDEIDDT